LPVKQPKGIIDTFSTPTQIKGQRKLREENMPVKICFCYSREDEPLLKKIKAHLRPMQREGLIKIWYDREIDAGMEWEAEIKKQLESAEIILLLISSDFMDSDYCYSKEMQQALARHSNGEAKVIPIILRPVYWQDAPFGKLQALPTETKPVTSWSNIDEAFLDIATGIQKAISNIKSTNLSNSSPLFQANQSQNTQEHALKTLPTNITYKHTKGFLSQSGVSTFDLLENHTVKCEVKNRIIFSKRITIFVDDREIFSRIFDDTDLFSGRDIHTFKVENVECLCSVSGYPSSEITIHVGKEEILRFFC
jgi:TIR domain